MRLPLTGGCLCGTIGYEISEAPVAAYVCHCRDCQTGTGSAFSVAVLVPDRAFRSTGGEAKSVFGGVTLSGRSKQRRGIVTLFGDRPRLSAGRSLRDLTPPYGHTSPVARSEKPCRATGDTARQPSDAGVGGSDHRSSRAPTGTAGLARVT
jgi:hypothetical protein